MNVDYLIIGQGIAGTLLSRNLLKAGKSVLVIDEMNSGSASRVAGGIINPATGKRLVRSWMIEELLPFAWSTYEETEREIGQKVVRSCDILDFHASREAEEIFDRKLEDEKEYLHRATDKEWNKYFRFNYSIGEIAPCLLVDLHVLTDGWRRKLKDLGALLEERFEWGKLKVGGDTVVYESIMAQKIICCEGAAGESNPYFRMLPWSKDKGEALIVSIPGLPRDHIFKQSFSIVPWKEDLFWVGATHDWKFTDMLPTPSFRLKVEEQLDYWLKLPYKVVEHMVSQRPANMERKPFVGLHPTHSCVGILNGMGGKGISMAPYFANELAMHLVEGARLTADADVRRFAKILSR